MWITVETDFPDHPKVSELCALLKEPLAEAYLVRIWCWAGRVAQDGSLRGASAGTSLEQAARWRGVSGELVAALVASGWLDRTPDGFCLHDWEQYAGKYLKKAAAERDRWHRRKHTGDSAESPRALRGKTETEKKIKKTVVPTTEKDREKPAVVADKELLDLLWEGFRKARERLTEASPDGFSSIPSPRPPECDRPRSWATAASAALEELGGGEAAGDALVQAYFRYLHDPAFATKGWPTAVFLHPNVWRQRVPRSRGAA